MLMIFPTIKSFVHLSKSNIHTLDLSSTDCMTSIHLRISIELKSMLIILPSNNRLDVRLSVGEIISITVRLFTFGEVSHSKSDSSKVRLSHENLFNLTHSFIILFIQLTTKMK